jgi:DnaJ-class molecular chaperone
MSDDLYATLGVSRDASQEDIKRSYRRLAKELHPDLNPDKPDVAERFKQVTAAYDILSDPERRGRYDRGEIDATGQERPRYQYRDFGERPEDQYYRDFAEDPAAGRYYTREGFGSQEEMQDFFEGLFGGLGRGRAGGGGRNFRTRARGADVSYTLPIDFLEAVRGTKKRVTMPDGRTIDLTIPAGAYDGQILRLRGQGMPGFEGGPPGDAYVELRVQPHPFFERKDHNIHLNLPITLAEAVLGGRIEVPTIDGPVTMTVPKGANTGTTLRLRGRGVLDQKSGQRGDQYVRLQVVLPKTPGPELEECVRRWARDNTYDPRADLRRSV